MARVTVKQLEARVAALEGTAASAPATTAPAANPVDTNPPDTNPPHQMKLNQRVNHALAAPAKPTLSAGELDLLHEVLDETDDPRIAKLLDRVCDDPSCDEELE